MSQEKYIKCWGWWVRSENIGNNPKEHLGWEGDLEVMRKRMSGGQRKTARVLCRENQTGRVPGRRETVQSVSQRYSVSKRSH